MRTTARQATTCWKSQPATNVGPMRTGAALMGRPVRHPHLGGSGVLFQPGLPSCRTSSLTYGCNWSPPSMWSNPSIMEFLEMRSKAPTPSTERIVARASRSVSVCCGETHSVPARVFNAYWNGAVVSSTAFETCCAMVRATTRRNASPTTMPPPGFCKAVTRPNLSNSKTRGGTCPLATKLANCVNASRSPSDSNIGKMFACHAGGSRNGTSSGLAHILCKPQLVQLENAVRHSTHQPTWDGRSRDRRPAFRVGEGSQSSQSATNALRAALNSPAIANFSARVALFFSGHNGLFGSSEPECPWPLVPRPTIPS